MHTTLDLLVLGGGPAGRALAAACAQRGLRVASLDPHPDHPWPNHYGIWVDELAPLKLTDCLAHLWPIAEVDAGGRRVLDRAYGSLSNDALRARLQAPCLEGSAVQVEHTPTGSTALLADGRRIDATLIVDATGRGLGPPRPTVGFQTAYGQMIHVDRHDIALDAVRLMDFSPVPGAPTTPPTFLYALPFGPDRLFVEETVLAGHPAPPFDVLEARLAARLAHLGITPRAIEFEERCLIPLGGPPAGPARLIPFGAAAGMIHPATGYSLGHTLRMAPLVADALVAGLAQGPAHAAQTAHTALWPRQKQRLWTIYRFGLEVLMGLDLPETQAFFRAFFTLDPDLQKGWLAGTLAVNEATRAMRGVFAELPGGLRAKLIGHGMLPHGWRLLGALIR
jgi:lycopene beta-cyclase